MGELPDRCLAEKESGERAKAIELGLKKPLRVADIWALGVGAVISGAYFGWNLGLRDNGPIAMLVATLLVCLLYLGWVLALAELSVAMPFAGGPLAYGRRALGPAFGFLMGWSMLLECQFVAIATALATGSYIAFLINPVEPSVAIRLGVALATIAIFGALHAWGVKEQSLALMLITLGAVLGLVLFWTAAAPSLEWARVWTSPLLPRGKSWLAVLEAVPFALWWLVCIETVALAAEEAHDAARTLPRGLVWAQLTLIVLAVLTWLFACGAMPAQELAVTVKNGVAEDVDYPLVKVMSAIPAGQNGWVFYSFGAIAVCGILASYHGIVFGTSRQAFSLGRAGYLPRFLGAVQATRHTPAWAVLASSLIAVGFVVANVFWDRVGTVAVLVSTLTALIWYILALACLFVLRRREPALFHAYQTPVRRVLPCTVLLLALVAACLYGMVNREAVWLTAILYGVGVLYYFAWARHKLQTSAPEELSACQGMRMP